MRVEGRSIGGNPPRNRARDSAPLSPARYLTTWRLPREWNEKEGEPTRGRGTSRKKGVEPRHTATFPGEGERENVGGEGTRRPEAARQPRARRIGTMMTMMTRSEATAIPALQVRGDRREAKERLRISPPCVFAYAFFPIFFSTTKQSRVVRPSRANYGEPTSSSTRVATLLTRRDRARRVFRCTRNGVRD